VTTSDRTAVVWVPDWPVVAAGAADIAAAVVHANRVVACSASARHEGVRRGLRRREAQARCPELEVIEHDPARDARAFEPVAAAVETLTPRVEIVRPGLCAFATRGPSRYFGGDDALAARVESVVQAACPNALSVACAVGIADGSFAASLAARHGVVVAPGATPAFLAPFPVSVLDRRELADLLQRLGLMTLGDLAALPPADVLGRFGTDGVIAHRLARGLDERPLAARVPAPDLAVQRELDPPAEQVEVAAFAARGLASELHEALAVLGLACARLLIEAETEHGEFLARLWRHEGGLTAAAVAERVRWQLDGWISSGATTAGLTLIRLTPDEVVPASGRQLGFWGGSAEADERAARALVRVQGMLGPSAVTTAVVVGGRAPGDRVRFVPWGDARTDYEAIGRGNRDLLPRNEREPWPGQVPAPAPATVYPHPQPVDVVDADGATVAVTGRGELTGEPVRLNDEPIVAWAGPWPVDERWWDPPAHRRRARLQVVVESGAAYLVAVEGGQWFIEAVYD
jgi:protein ImuB